MSITDTYALGRIVDALNIIDLYDIADPDVQQAARELYDWAEAGGDKVDTQPTIEDVKVTIPWSRADQGPTGDPIRVNIEDFGTSPDTVYDEDGDEIESDGAQCYAWGKFIGELRDKRFTAEDGTSVIFTNY